MPKIILLTPTAKRTKSLIPQSPDFMQPTVSESGAMASAFGAIKSEKRSTNKNNENIFFILNFFIQLIFYSCLLDSLGAVFDDFV